MSSVNETLIRDVVAQVLGRLGQSPGSAPSKEPCGCGNGHVSGGSIGQRKFGVFQDANEACAAAHRGFLQLKQKGMAARARIVEIIKTMADANAIEWGKMEIEETKIGRLDHKIEKLKIIKLVPGVEWLHPDGRSGDHGIMLEEYTPFGVVAAITPSTHSIPTLSGNIVNIVAAGNGNLITIIEQPTLESFKTICDHEAVRLLCVTGGPAVVKAAMQTGKRAICAGPGNPPVLVDDTACMTRAAKSILQGAAYDNNLLCIGEKEVFVLDSVADKLMGEMEKAGAVRLNASQLDRLTKEAFTFKEGQGAGCPEPVVSRALIGKDAAVLAKAAGANVPEKTELLFAETDKDHLFVKEEQMMPFVPVVRVRSIEEGIEAARVAEHNYKHTSIIHSHDVEHMTAMARALDTTLFIKNGSCMAGLGLGGEGYLSYSIATPTGEGVTNPKTFCRVRRCVMVDNLRIY